MVYFTLELFLCTCVCQISKSCRIVMRDCTCNFYSVMLIFARLTIDLDFVERFFVRCKMA